MARDVASNKPREPCQVLQEQTGMSSQQPTSIPQHPWDALHVIGPLQWSLQTKQTPKQSLSNIWELVGPAAENSATYFSNLKLRNVHTKPQAQKGGYSSLSLAPCNEVGWSSMMQSSRMPQPRSSLQSSGRNPREVFCNAVFCLSAEKPGASAPKTSTKMPSISTLFCRTCCLQGITSNSHARSS